VSIVVMGPQLSSVPRGRVHVEVLGKGVSSVTVTISLVEFLFGFIHV
jgi:hypothetical protein